MTLDVIELDSLRADLMRLYLNEEGRRYIWRYDVGSLRTAFRLALYDQNYDSIQRDGDGIKAGHRYALIGPGIEDHPFTTPEELRELVYWLCQEGYLSCYKATVALAVPTKGDTP